MINKLNKQPKRGQRSKNSVNGRLPDKAHPHPKLEGDTPMDKFNHTMRKILSVSKKDLKQK